MAKILYDPSPYALLPTSAVLGTVNLVARSVVPRDSFDDNVERVKANITKLMVATVDSFLFLGVTFLRLVVILPSCPQNP
jgi:hypothetical protein